MDPNLVRAIAAQVMAALRGGGLPAGGEGGGIGAGPVAVRPPIGICTGDYSKFPELAGMRGGGAELNKGSGERGQGSGDVAAAISESAGGLAGRAGESTGRVPVTALKGVITVSQLRQIRGSVRLAKGAILTPLAADYIKEKNIHVLSDTLATPVAVNAGRGAVGHGARLPVYWWIDGACPSVAKVTEALRPNVYASRERGESSNLRGVVKELASLVRQRKVSGGILFVPNAARAICYANRCASLRAIVGTSDRAVSDGIEQLGANVLVIEYPQHGFKSMWALVKPFIESGMGASNAVEKELNELRNCG